jgi:DNA-binding response OmpR family regulator
MSLEEGADDYLNKPFDPFELAARIKAVLRRGRPQAQPLAGSRHLMCGPLRLDRPARRLWLDGKEIVLTAKAFSLLEYLMLHHGDVVRRERLLDEIWGWEYPSATRAVDIRIAELRRALGDDPDRPRYLETVIGEGYRFLGSVEGQR